MGIYAWQHAPRAPVRARVASWRARHWRRALLAWFAATVAIMKIRGRAGRGFSPRPGKFGTRPPRRPPRRWRPHRARRPGPAHRPSMIAKSGQSAQTVNSSRSRSGGGEGVSRGGAGVEDRAAGAGPGDQPGVPQHGQVIADAADRLPQDDGELGGAGRLLQGEQDGGAGGAEEPVKRRAGPGPGRLLPERGDPAGGIDQGRRPGRIQAQGEPGPDEHGRNEQQAAPAQLGVFLAGPAAELDPALVPAQAGVHPGQRGRPAPGGELPGAVHHVPLQDGPQRGPLGLEQDLPGRGQHVGGVGRDLVPGQDPLDPGIDGRLPPQRFGDLAVRLLRRRRPDLGEQVADRGGQGRRNGGQEGRAPAGGGARARPAGPACPPARAARCSAPTAARSRTGSWSGPRCAPRSATPSTTSFRPVTKEDAVDGLSRTMAAMTTAPPSPREAPSPSPSPSPSPPSRARPALPSPPLPRPAPPPPPLPGPAPGPRPTYRSVFAVSEFRVLFAAQLMYILGFEFEILGLSVLVYAQTRSAFLTALAFSMGFAPQAIGGALFTALADRLPPRIVIGTGLVIRAGPGLAIGLWPGCPVPAMLALVAVTATAAPVFSAAISGLLPEVFDGDRHVLARSVFSLTSSGTQIIGLGIGGAVLAVVPARWLLLAAGLSLVAAAVISRLGL